MKICSMQVTKKKYCIHNLSDKYLNTTYLPLQQVQCDITIVAYI